MTKRSKIILAVLLLIFPVAVSYGQLAETVKFVGAIKVLEVGEFPFELTYQVNGNRISGTSVTNGGNKNETKSAVSGTIHANGTILFRETSIINTKIKDKSSSFCFISSVLTKRTALGMETLRGRFTGKDKSGAMCGTGEIYLVKQVKVIPDSLKTAIKALIDTAIEKPSAKVKQLSVTSVNTIYCKGKTVGIRFYDAGYVDGDQISILYNGRQVCEKQVLTKEGLILKFSLQDGQENLIAIKTLNVGSNPPNTATIDVEIAPGNMKTYQFNAMSNTIISVRLASQP